MPTYKIIYRRADMKIPCSAIKTAHTEKEAIECLCTGSEKKGYRLDKKGPAGVMIQIQDVKEL